MSETIEPTAEDWENARRSLENPREQFIETLARMEARQRIERELRQRRERRRRLIRRLLLLER